MATYEVKIFYSGFNTYIVDDAEDEDAAGEIAKQRFHNDDNGEDTGSEEERIDDIKVEVMDANVVQVFEACCAACGGELIPMGTLGRRDHFRCRACGLDTSMKAEDGQRGEA